MANSNTYLTTPTKTPSSRRNQQSQSKMQSHSKDPINAESRSRFEAYNRLQAAAVAFGEKLPIPEIVAIGGQSDGKSSLLEALLGFRFNVREVEMGTRRPLILQMVHDLSALEPRCRFQDEDSEEYGGPIVSATAVADVIRSRTESLLKKTKTAVSSKPIVMRAEYAHCPNLTIIDTPGFVLKAKQGEPETTPDEILSMVKSLASPPHRILLFLQQSSVEWCSSLWLDAVREIDSSFRRTIVVVSKFDNRLKEFSDRGEVDRYLSASGYLGENTRPYFVALPKDRSTVSNDEFRRQISQVDTEVIRHLREGVKGGFDEEKFRSYIGFGSLRDFLESELQKRYKEAAPATLALLEQRCSEVTDDMLRMEMKIQATSDVAHLRKAAMLYTASISNHVGALIDGAANPAPEQWGKTTEEERGESGIGSWPGVSVDIKPPNAVLKLYGGAAFERVIHEFRCAAYSIECPPVSREKVANILLAHAGRGGGRGVTEASAEIARTAARSWLAPLLDTACDRLAFVLGSLFEIALERNLNQNSEYEKKTENMDGYVGFHAAVRNCYSRFVKNLAKQCKQLVRHHLDSVTSPYSMACYENDYHQGGAFGSYNKFNQASGNSFCFELSDTSRDEPMKDQENIPPENNNGQETTPGKGGESHITVPETPSPDQPCEIVYGLVKKEIGNGPDGVGARKRMARMVGNRNIEPFRVQNGGLMFGNGDNGMKSSSAYSEICSSAAQHFARIREVLVERSVTSTLNSGFLTPCRDRLVVALGLDLFAVNDDKFMDMFVAPGAIDVLQNERQQLQKRQKILQSCLTEFKTVARSL
ncbi:dynamin family protein [Arabidopsis lyrata subsp. lyrata]|uniref:Dynamin family protein n=1 Tax=Arabidopsis lyrata subsp. lyrata TaxID=81972 RepID=D7KKE2_ARALL|nr:dynamin-related protein 5A [Arabidopsis lyrata subsp. lyrata]EFH67989.1 dynamin family protein [Arabidopsis lyrata subsp. lyrata]|eukprot:XP_002891730.1 dynamin-related protein 5A [Arabidopsis lyrata subsp. lyrata]